MVTGVFCFSPGPAPRLVPFVSSLSVLDVCLCFMVLGVKVCIFSGFYLLLSLWTCPLLCLTNLPRSLPLSLRSQELVRDMSVARKAEKSALAGEGPSAAYLVRFNMTFEIQIQYEIEIQHEI